MTPFEKAKLDHARGILRVPTVSVPGGEIPYWKYQLAVHKFNLSLMAKGMTFRGITFTQIKKYYGLKGRGAADVLPGFMKIIEAHLN